jgi:hypothetical protein
MYVCMYATSFVRLDKEWKLLKLKLHWVTIINKQYKVYLFCITYSSSIEILKKKINWKPLRPHFLKSFNK